MKNKIAIYLVLFLLGIGLSQVILAGWYSAVGLMEGFWLKEKFNPITVNYKAKRLWELPVERQIEKVFGKDAEMAKAISKAESGMRCEAVSYTGDVGPFQINHIHQKRGNILDCTTNILVAKQIFDEQSWRPWVAYNTGAYKRFLK